MRRGGGLARAAAALVLVALPVTGCIASSVSNDSPVGRPPVEEPIPIRIGALPAEDLLPLWVAEQKGYFADEGLESVEVVEFQSAQERDAALASGAVDAFVSDMISAVNLEAAGTGVTIVTVVLGATQAEGRFGVVERLAQEDEAAGGPRQEPGRLTALAGVPIGVTPATIHEYVLDGLMAEAGVSASDMKVKEVEAAQASFELLMAGKLNAAVLHEPLLSLAVARGATLAADDVTAKRNLSQTILGVADVYLAKQGGTESVDALLGAWDRAVADINSDPEAHRALLVEKAGLPQEIAKSYRISTYPVNDLPKKEEIDAVEKWMKDKGYLDRDVSYEDLTLVLPPKGQER